MNTEIINKRWQIVREVTPDYMYLYAIQSDKAMRELKSFGTELHQLGYFMGLDDQVRDLLGRSIEYDKVIIESSSENLFG